MKNAILVRYGEIGLKGRNRPLFERRLARNIESALEDLGSVRVQRIFGRLLVELEEEALPEALRRIPRIFGIVGASPTRICPLTMEAVEEAALQEAAEAMARAPKTFRIQARRSNKGFPLTSAEINQQLGGAVLRRFPQLQVDLERPDLTLHVEIRDRAAYVYSDEVKGPGGLPVGVGNRGLLLLSGGIDSPVAGWMIASRGVAVEAIHFHSFPFTSEGAQQKAIDLSAVLSRWTGDFTLHMIRFTDIQTAIQRNVPPSWGITIMRRFMMRIAERLARERGIPALITGESLGQVASQTIESIVAIEDVVTMPVLRPLIALDKEAIVERAEHIETYPISVRPYDDCCTIFVAKHPETRPSLEGARRMESALDVEPLVEEALAGRMEYRWRWGKAVEVPAPAGP